MNIKISVVIAYISIIIIWSTTPLAIKWSSFDVDFITGVAARMLIGTIAALIVCWFAQKQLATHKKALLVYVISSISIFGSMMLVYYGAQYINSGLVSVMFGLSPLLTSIFAIYLFASERFTLAKISGALIGLVGLIYIFKEQLSIGEQASIGIISILTAVNMHVLSALWIKQVDIKLSALSITTGGLLCSFPMFLISYLLFADPLPDVVASRTIYSIIYLGIMGSVVGFICFYYVLANMAASNVALITLITPVIALMIGDIFNHETISLHLWIGTALILIGLLVHQIKSKQKVAVTI